MPDKDDIEKYKNKLKEIAGRDNIIPGIFNYCDRWCERCSFVSQCTLGISEFEMAGHERDMQNKEFWEHLSLVFQATSDMITEAATEFGIDISTATTEYAEPVHHTFEAEKLAKEYGMQLLNWLKANHEMLDQKATIISLINEKQLISFRDAVEVIRWYSLFISVKIHRATLASHAFDDEETDTNDRTGSAKIAMIAVSRSLEAFSFLYNHLPEQEDEILKFLSELSHINKLLLKIFPGAINFKRPGFDD